jgi:hypothetical protein
VVAGLVNGPSLAPGLIWLGFESGGIYPLDLASAGYPGCKLYTNFLITMPVTVTNGSSDRVQIGIPNDNSLVCARFYMQGLAVVVQPSLNVEFSDFLRVLIGL